MEKSCSRTILKATNETIRPQFPLTSQKKLRFTTSSEASYEKQRNPWCVILGNLFCLSKPQFYQLQNRDINSFYFIKLLWRLNKIIIIKHLIDPVTKQMVVTASIFHTWPFNMLFSPLEWSFFYLLTGIIICKTIKQLKVLYL